jgi:PAS domain S-box-containing protein
MPESSLKESVWSLLRDAFEDAPFEFWARDLSGRCIVANAEGRLLDGVLGHKVEDAAVSPDMLAAWQANNQRAYAGEAVLNEFEYGEGELKRHLQCYIVPVRVSGQIQGILGLNIDVTRHRGTQQALHDSERRLSEALRVGRMGWLDWDLVTNTIRWSPETYRLFGLDPAVTPTVEGTMALVPAEDLEVVRASLEAGIAGTAPHDIVHRMKRQDGEIIHVHALGEVMRDADGKPLRMLGTLVDVTARKRAEEELREVDRQRSEFLGVLSHELRNPLAVIGSSVHSINCAELADPQIRRAVAVIDRQTRHLARLVDDLLDITRVRSGKIDLQRRPVDLVQLVRTTVEDHRDQLAAHVITIEVPDAPVWTQGDPTRLAQILGNVLNNAAKFTPAGGAVSVSLAIAQRRAVLEVTDTGVGIDAESLAQLFVPFVQADRSLDRSRQGLGLGLALVKTLVELHGGKVHACSAGPGQGACLSITLPLVDCEPTESRPKPRVAASPRNVLIIEDDPDVAEWLAHALTFSGHRVTTAIDGTAGLDKARQLSPDVILCDLGLPGGLDGYAVARRLQQDATLAHCYRIALSGYTQPEDQARARAAGFEAHISKPPDLAALEAMLAALPTRR